MSALRLLVVEGSADDALPIVREVEGTWPELDWRRVETAEELEAAFADGAWDAVVADDSLPGLDTLETLRLVRTYGYDGPFIVVSDTVGEEMIVAAMRAGAHDYVRKDDLRRLVPALEREFEEACLRTRSPADEPGFGASEELYFRLARQLPGVVWATDALLRVTAVSGAAAIVPALAEAAVVGVPVERLAASIGIFDVAEHRRVLAGAHVDYEASWSGREYVVHVKPLLDQGGVADGCIAVALDLTERRTAQRKLRESEARFRALIESSLDVTMLLEEDATVRYASPSVERVLGFRPEELVGRRAFDLVHPEDAPALAEIFRLAGGSPGATRTTTYRALHRDGTWRLTEAVGLNMLADPSVRGMVISTRDITSRHALEERLNQAERLEAIGQLAGGIAHDFNNILLVIRGYSSVLSAELTDPELLADAAEITKATERAANLTQQLLVF
ncbi:MAG TPA: PAS domain S-box protein, partial [Gaiellaceae bacterium]|nr:PAS domain S-box protein [Gaiellaceae bacterium]